ncbi:MAG: large-conductance mechanosensitive channel [Bacteroidetes bacterium CG2_30_32_10]|nr:MAG: large-conductance mechanosensitive channel [Bacteroidetes bacterium CG2_30_32_10]
MGVIKEFKEFASKGSVVDLAVGIIIGGAFGKIISSLVSDILMPPIGYIIGGLNFTDLKFTLLDGYVNNVGKTIPAVTINIGNFIQTFIDFIIIAFALFLIIKGMNKMKRKQEKPATPAEPPKSEVLLTEIRDLLKK